MGTKDFQQGGEFPSQPLRVAGKDGPEISLPFRIGKVHPGERWPQYSWRPWCGLWFPVAVILIYFVLPVQGKAVPAVPTIVWIGWLAILGVSVLGRNKEKVIKAGGNAEGFVASAIKAIKG
jgi:hypothetical protein